MDKERSVSESTGRGFFTGTYIHSLDAKKRLTVPSEWRDLVDESKRFFLIPSVDAKCLSLYTMQDFEHRLARLRERSMADPKARLMARILGSQSTFVSWDTAGRIRVKDELLEYAEIADQVAMVGTFDRIELWNAEEWKRMKGEEDELTILKDAIQYVGF
jgi:MraZ protein